EIARLRHERGGDSARQMCLAAGLVRECVEDAEDAGAQTQREPRDRGRLLLDHREAALQEGLDLAFLAGLRLELHVQCDLDHDALLPDHDALLPPATASA